MFLSFFKRKRFLAFFLLTLFLITSLFAQVSSDSLLVVDNDPHAKGLIEPTAEEVAWMDQNKTDADMILVNQEILPSRVFGRH